MYLSMCWLLAYKVHIIIEITTYFKSSSDLFSFSALAKEMAPVEDIFMFDKLQLKGNISTLNQLYCLQQHCNFFFCIM